MQIEPFLTASAVDCVVAQRLARQLYTHCKKGTMLSLDALKASGFDVRYDVEGYEPVGCPRCSHSGYKGRIGMYEVMLVSDAIRSMTIERTSADRIRAKAIEEGMRPLREDGLEKVRQGVTSIAEVARIT
ncbi:MAG: hypothetical protein H0T15_01265 [Thermoleophilaceae bacterium]|nr:hypothetical protein [Thermoleophilaceae bacterium]